MVCGRPAANPSLLRPQLRRGTNGSLTDPRDCGVGRVLPRRSPAKRGDGISVSSGTVGECRPRSGTAGPERGGDRPVSWPRIIVCLDVAGGRVVKGTRFKDLRDVGDLVDLA